LASAGYAARADDPATVFKNPAGMDRLNGTQFQLGTQAIYGQLTFAPSDDTSARLGENDGGNASGWIPGGSLFVTHEVSDRWTVGLGALTYFAAASRYEEDWVGRYYVEKGGMVGLSLTPSASFRATEWLAVGVGLNAMYGLMGSESAVNNPDAADGLFKFNDRVWGLGANVGLLVEPVAGSRWGVTYLSPVNLDFEDTPTLSGLGSELTRVLATPTNLDLALTVPQSVMFSLHQELSSQWVLMADVGWQDWSQFEEVWVGVDTNADGVPGIVRTVNDHYQDTWHGALGAQFRPNQKWQFTGGVAFDSSAIAAEHRTVTLPTGRAWRFGLGAQWKVTRDVQLSLSYGFLWSGDLQVDQGSDASLSGQVAGTYENTFFSTVATSLVWAF
jgi:long-chain fatty acid transport protein